MKQPEFVCKLCDKPMKRGHVGHQADMDLVTLRNLPGYYCEMCPISYAIVINNDEVMISEYIHWNTLMIRTDVDGPSYLLSSKKIEALATLPHQEITKENIRRWMNKLQNYGIFQ